MAALPPALFRPWYGSWRRAPLVWFGMFVFQVVALNAMVMATLGRPIQWKGRPV